MQEKTMKQMQQEVDDYISQFKEGYFSPLAMLARLTEELGELAREVNHYYGEKPKKATEQEKTVKKSWAICCLCSFASPIRSALICRRRTTG
ncbi:ATP diphosphatase [Geobacillus sp. WSUCF1]|nr:ATP diphosphatase [Geobacillus sp. WSUCF1]